MMSSTPPSGPPSPTLFVTGLPVDCTAEFAKSIFGQYGIVKDARMLPVAPGKTAAAAVVVMTTADDAKWIVDHVNGNVPQSLTQPVTVTFKFKGKGFEKGFGKGMDLSALSGLAAGLGGGMGGKGAEDGNSNANPAVAGLLQLLVPLVGAVAGMQGGGKGGWVPPKPPPGQQICRYFEAGMACPRDGCTFWHGDSNGGAGAGMDTGMGNGMGMGMGKGAGPPMGKGAPSYKTRMCDFYMQGKCTWGENCKFAHYPNELIR
ncbi:unnamed protein product [Symbiodinium pilosum]|uniref:Uncharacterized protein n=1 Tax=Symbiodinium pilosum TaxID=2952 RepID=A0A812UVV9_SYMPI|nr:unnamed protein product [Symbiodinium pilosum]